MTRALCRRLKTYLRGPGKVLRSQKPDMVRQEIYGYLLTHYAISAVICQAATAAGWTRTGSSSSAPSASSAAGPPTRLFPPEQRQRGLDWIMADITRRRTSTRRAATGPTRGSSSAPGTTPTASRDPPTTASGTTARPQSGWSTSARSPS